MKHALIIGAILLVLILGIGTVLILMKKEEPAPTTGNTPTFPSGGTIRPGDEPAGTLVIADREDEPLEVPDFRGTEDPFVPGQYTIAGGTDADDPAYDIFYQETDYYFGITLYKEPLGQTRRDAEGKLRATLRLTDEEMCRLSYVVAPGPGVSELYTGTNLGFSFCPGATVLP